MQRRRLLLLVLAVGASLLLAACGGSTSASPSSTSTTNGASTANGSQSGLSACLKAKGITVPAGFGAGRGAGPSGASGATGATGATPGSRPAGGTRGSLPAGVDRQKFQQALQACGGGNGFGGGGGANAQAFTAYLSCLSDHGVTVPTSTSGTQARGAGALSAVRSDPKFATANKTCQALLPTSGSTTTTTG